MATRLRLIRLQSLTRCDNRVPGLGLESNLRNAEAPFDLAREHIVDLRVTRHGLPLAGDRVEVDVRPLQSNENATVSNEFSDQLAPPQERFLWLVVLWYVVQAIADTRPSCFPQAPRWSRPVS